jgi:hypothetical protein
MAEELTKGPDEIYCPECGRTIGRGLQVCPLCNADFRKIFPLEESRDIPSENTSSYQNYYQPAAVPVRRDPVKNKVVAVILAFFFGYWSWLYTYKKNMVKFWSALGVIGLLFIINISYSCSFIQDAVSGTTYPDDYFSGGFLTFVILINIVNFGVWVWALVDNATKPESFYMDYPNG